MHIRQYTQHCWQHYVTHSRCQPICPISAFLYKYKKRSACTPKFLNFIKWYATENV